MGPSRLPVARPFPSGLKAMAFTGWRRQESFGALCQSLHPRFAHGGRHRRRRSSGRGDQTQHTTPRPRVRARSRERWRAGCERSQTRTVPSLPAVARRLPSALHATPKIPPLFGGDDRATGLDWRWLGSNCGARSPDPHLVILAGRREPVAVGTECDVGRPAFVGAEGVIEAA